VPFGSDPFSDRTCHVSGLDVLGHFGGGWGVGAVLRATDQQSAGALLKDHEIDFGKIVHQELLPEND
jgi:hypothetical protein